VDGSGTANYVAKWSDANTLTDSVVYDNGTNVGIGTSSPQSKLDIVKQGNASGGTMMLSGSKTNNQVKYGIITTSQYASDTETEGVGLIGGVNTSTENIVVVGGGIDEINTATSIRFYSAANTTTRGSANERMRVNEYGQLLINAVSSAYGNLNLGYNLGVRGTNSQTYISIARANQTLDSEGMIVGLDTADGYVLLRDNINLKFGVNGGVNLTVAASTGNVLIGTTTDVGAKLYVNGETRATSFTNAGALGTGSNNARNHFTQLGAGTASPATGWIAAAFGEASADRIVIGQWTNGAQQAIFGAHTGNLNDWADTNYVSKNHNFYVNGAWSSPASMTLNTSGNLLIGTNTDNGARLKVTGPVYFDNSSSRTEIVNSNDYSLQVTQSKDTGASTFSEALFLLNSFENDNGFVAIGMSTNGTDGQHHRVSLRALRDGNVGGQFQMALREAGTSNNVVRVNVKSNGNFLIGTTTDSGYKLDVNGTALVRGNFYTAGELGIELSWTGNTLNDSRNGRIRPISTPAQNPYAGGLAFDYYKYDGSAYNWFEGMRLNGSGNVGIGTASPTNKLTIQSNSAQLRLETASDPSGYHSFIESNYNAANPLNIYSSAAASYAMGTISLGGISGVNTYLNSYYGIIFGTSATSISAGTVRMMIANGGNVLIGTTTDAGYKLDVAGSGRFSGLLQVNGPDSVARTDSHGISLYNNNVDYRISFDSQSGTKGFIRYNVDTAGSSSHGHIFSAGDFSGGSITDLMLVRADGSVGIGTTSPGYKLDVVAGANSTYPFIVRNAGNAEIGGIYSTSGGAGQIYLFNASTVTTVKISTIDSSYFNGGNVGIGTTAPQQLLHVLGATDGYMMVQGAADAGNAGIYFKKEDTTGTMDRTKGLIVFHTNVGSGFGRGHLGFCLNSAESNTVVSITDEKFRMVDNGDFLADGDVVAYSTTISDERYKTNITPIESALDKVNQMRGVSFDWTAVRSGREFGVIAQEIEKIAPEVVSEKELLNGETMKTVSYTSLVPFLIESIKELTQQVNELKAQLDGLTK
jgi:hypothetical protein